MTIKRKTILDIKAAKGGTPLVCLTAYTAPFAKILNPYTDILLVGDSVGMALYGMDSTLSVTIDMMINHGKAVVRASKSPLITVDMPFASYQKNKEEAFKNAARILAETGCTAVKLEGGVVMSDTIEFLVKRGIPVIGHVGLMPQLVNTSGGYKYKGKTNQEYQIVIEDALAVEKAGAFSIVLEGVTENLAAEITGKLSIPTIGIGASTKCDGQILVTEDMAGLFGDSVPKFVKCYGNMKEVLENATQEYANNVRKRTFPTQKECFSSKFHIV